MVFSTQHLGKNFHHFKTIDSTQIFVKKLFQEKNAEIGMLVLADHQQVGKGTQGRKWFSLPNPQLMFSLLIRPTLAPQKLPIINILCGVLMASIFEKMGAPASVKWPNDVYIDGKKAGGILSELHTQHGQADIILGVGMNLDAKKEDFPDDLQANATALSLYCKSVDRFEILNRFLVELEKALYTWSSDELIAFTQTEFKRLWLYQNQTIEITQDRKTFQGTASEIDPFGALMFKTAHGVEKIISGSIRVIDKHAKSDYL